MFEIHSSSFGAKTGFENVVLKLVEIKLLFLGKFHLLFSFLTAVEHPNSPVCFTFKILTFLFRITHRDISVLVYRTSS